MKTKTTPMILLMLAACSLLVSCATPSDPTFIQNAAASINGGLVSSPDGRMMMAPGLQNRNRPHPFFAAP